MHIELVLLIERCWGRRIRPPDQGCARIGIAVAGSGARATVACTHQSPGE